MCRMADSTQISSVFVKICVKRPFLHIFRPKLTKYVQKDRFCTYFSLLREQKPVFLFTEQSPEPIREQNSLILLTRWRKAPCLRPAKRNYSARRPFSRRSWAIWTALVAAPLRRLSATHQRLRPFSTEKSRRMRPTKTSSLPSAKRGIG